MKNTKKSMILIMGLIINSMISCQPFSEIQSMQPSEAKPATIQKEGYGEWILAGADKVKKSIFEERAQLSQKARALDRLSAHINNQISYEATEDIMIMAMEIAGHTVKFVETNGDQITGISLFATTIIASMLKNQ